MSGERRWGRPHVGDHIHFKVFGEAETWGVVVAAGDRNDLRFKARMLDTGDIDYVEHEFMRIHGCEAWEEPPDEFYVWQAKHALLT